MSTRTGVYQGKKAAFFVSNQSWQRSVVVSKRRTARVTVGRRSREGTKRERLGDEEARCKMQTGAGGQREEGERGAEGETRAEDIAFWSCLEFGRLGGSLLPRPPTRQPESDAGRGRGQGAPTPCPPWSLRSACIAGGVPSCSFPNRHISHTVPDAGWLAPGVTCLGGQIKGGMSRGPLALG